jgi:hypothetical protein
MGRCNISVIASLQDDPDPVDNTHSYWVTMTISGDVNGVFDADIFDIIWMASAYNTEKVDPRFQSNF